MCIFPACFLITLPQEKGWQNTKKDSGFDQWVPEVPTLKVKKRFEADLKKKKERKKKIPLHLNTPSLG